ncbi:MAG: AAA family ATPase [Spirochaetaceae bacterium]|nr:AAA family ATPase [Spirochaetaceae bacterium]
MYDHRIDLNLEDRVTLLHGPNGVGKTSILRMIDGLLRNNFTHFRRIPFARILLGFQDASVLELRTDRDAGRNQESGKLTLTTKHGQDRSSTVSLGPSEAESIAAKVDFLRPHASAPDTWIDVTDGEVLSESEVLSRFRGLPPGRKNRLKKSPAWLREFLNSANTYLIEAQRLVRTPWDPGSADDFRFRRSRRPAPFISRVEECSLDFQIRLSDTMATYGRQAQTLDQTFPQRLISATAQLSQDELRDRMTTLDKKTEEFKSIGILDETPAHPFDANSLRDMDYTQARVMTLYVQDTEGKLEALDNLASRTRLLLDNVNGKFRNKQIRLDRNSGLVAEMDGNLPLPLEALSSGEQHELVLHYDLLFRVRPNTVVLIDEPELSLHVGWQKKFLPDLKQIVELSGFDAVVATHSPFIVGDDDDLMVGLGDVDSPA